jgi:hypothetical protein
MALRESDFRGAIANRAQVNNLPHMQRVACRKTRRIQNPPQAASLHYMALREATCV